MSTQTVNLEDYAQRSGYLQAHLELARETIKSAIASIDANPQRARGQLQVRLEIINMALRQVEGAGTAINGRLREPKVEHVCEREG